MAKKYAVLRIKTPKPEGGFWEAFRLGLVDYGSTGEEYFDESGYPFPDEVHAFVHDWLNLSGDFAQGRGSEPPAQRDVGDRIWRGEGGAISLRDSHQMIS
jgi:hypothetical protein